MGRFIYGTPAISVEIDDRILAHLKVVMVAKLRRGESFAFTWGETLPSDEGHSTIWLNPAVPIKFEFASKQEPRLNRAWLDELVHSANSPAGLRILPEPAQAEGT